MVVNPPHETRVSVEGLTELLSRHVRDEVPSELIALSSQTRIDGIRAPEIDSITVSKEGVRILGTAVVEETLEYGGGSDRDGTEFEDSFPLSFDLLLDHDLRIKPGSRVNADVSSFYG